jgi:hypothetical protein
LFHPLREAHIQPVAVGWPGLEVPPFVAETLRTEQLAVLDLDGVLTPRIRVI